MYINKMTKTNQLTIPPNGHIPLESGTFTQVSVLSIDVYSFCHILSFSGHLTLNMVNLLRFKLIYVKKECFDV